MFIQRFYYQEQAQHYWILFRGREKKVINAVSLEYSCRNKWYNVNTAIVKLLVNVFCIIGDA